MILQLCIKLKTFHRLDIKEKYDLRDFESESDLFEIWIQIRNPVYKPLLKAASAEAQVCGRGEPLGSAEPRAQLSRLRYRQVLYVQEVLSTLI